MKFDAIPYNIDVLKVFHNFRNNDYGPETKLFVKICFVTIPTDLGYKAEFLQEGFNDFEKIALHFIQLYGITEEKQAESWDAITKTAIEITDAYLNNLINGN